MALSCARAVTAQLNKSQDTKVTAIRMRCPTVTQNARVATENLPSFGISDADDACNHSAGGNIVGSTQKPKSEPMKSASA